MDSRRFPLKTSIVAGFLVVLLGTAAGMGARSAVLRASDRAALAAIEADTPKALRKVRASEDARLKGGAVPIDRAMEVLATKGRMGLPAELLPQPSTDTAPLAGWAGQMHDVPPWMMAAPGDGGH